MSFGARLRDARANKGMTQTDLGKGLGTDGKDCTKAVVHGWEKGGHHPRVDQLELICKKLGVGADYLLFGTSVGEQLSPEVAEVARDISALPERQRRWVLSTVKDAIELARETFQVTQSPLPDAREDVDASQPPTVKQGNTHR
jgi:transcriptional regulator with XRE-family HTH domain